MVNLLIADALRVAREHGCKDVWRCAAYYLAGQYEIAIRDGEVDRQQGFSCRTPTQPTRALKVDRKDAGPLAVSKW